MPFKGVFPAAKVTPAPYGLFSVADVQRHGARDEHWAGGFDQESEACSFNASIIDVCGAETPIEIYNTSDDPRWSEVKPFGIVAKDYCLTPGHKVVDRRARVLRQLDLITPKAVERELWLGEYRQAVDGDTDGEYLSSSAATVAGGVHKPKVGLALLEQALANCSSGFQGVIHMSPLVASMMGMDLRVEGKQLVTTSGNLVAVGAGYTGAGPGTQPEQPNFVHHMFATGPVIVHLGINELVTVSESAAVDTKTNEMTYVAERPASVHWDGCCHLGVQVDVRL